MILSISIAKQPPEVLYKKAVIKNLAILTGKNRCPSLFFNEVAKRRLQHFS